MQAVVPLRQFCDYLGVDCVQPQRQRLLRDEELASEVMSVAVTPTQIHKRGDHNRPVLCLPLDLLPGWLFGVTPSRVKPEYRERVRLLPEKVLSCPFGKPSCEESYSLKRQRRLRSVVPSTVEKTVVPLGDQHIDALTEQINNLTAIVAFLQEHRRMLLEEAGQVVTIVEAGQQELLGRADHLSTQLTYVSSLLEQLVGRQSTTEAQVAKIEARTQRLTPAHARNVQGLVEKIVRESERRPPERHRTDPCTGVWPD